MTDFDRGPLEQKVIGAEGLLTDSDMAELNEGTKKVYLLMRDGQWHHPNEILAAAKGREGLRRMRELRVYFEIDKRQTTGTRLWEYRLVNYTVSRCDDLTGGLF